MLCDVIWFDVAMYTSLFVQVLQRSGNVHKQIGRLMNTSRAPVIVERFLNPFLNKEILSELVRANGTF